MYFGVLSEEKGQLNFENILKNIMRDNIVSAHRRMWSVTNYFLLNLSVADILMAALNCTVSFLYMRDRLETFLSLHWMGVLVGFPEFGILVQFTVV